MLVSEVMRQPFTVTPGLEIAPRSAWADADPTGPLEAEAPGDVRFLLVHHTASSNDYSVDEVPGLLRSFYGYHTGPDKNWPDIAYNFMVDRFGGVWEARAGSISSPIKGSATGGSQGFALLCCLVGNHDEAPPTPEAVASLARLLGWLAHTYDIAIGPGETTTFVSRGSSRWPEGSAVTTSTISGHRDMSSTTCPGDHVVELIQSDIVPAAQQAAGQTSPPTTEPPTTEPPTTEPSATDVPTTVTSTTVPSTSGPASTSTSGADPEVAATTAQSNGGRSLMAAPLAAGAVVAAGAVGAVIAFRRRTLD